MMKKRQILHPFSKIKQEGVSRDLYANRFHLIHWKKLWSKSSWKPFTDALKKGDWEELTDLPRVNHWTSLVALHDEMAVSVYREQESREQEENNIKAIYSVLLTKSGQCGLEG